MLVRRYFAAARWPSVAGCRCELRARQRAVQRTQTIAVQLPGQSGESGSHFLGSFVDVSGAGVPARDAAEGGNDA